MPKRHLNYIGRVEFVRGHFQKCQYPTLNYSLKHMSAELESKCDTWSEGYPPDWNERRKIVLRRDSYRCQHCRIRSTRLDDISLDVDHIIPKSKGGTHEVSNLRTLCPECHSNRHPENENLNNRSNRLTGGFIRDVWKLFYTRYLSNTGSVSIDQEGRVIDFDPIETVPTLDDGRAITVLAKVVRLWDASSDKIAQSGILVPAEQSEAELDSPVKFVIWENARVRRIHENETYVFLGAKTREYNDEMEISIDNRTEIIVHSRLP